jgi:3-deoxy-D-manno-octulosonate 8-phosphate phosphatase (KDO 8-P phosphatase)
VSERPPDDRGERLGPQSAAAPRERATPPAAETPTPETEAIESLIAGPAREPVRILFVDADGTLTDGVIGVGSDGGDFRHFYVRDGLALQWAAKLAVVPVVISGRASQAVVARMKDLGVEHYHGVGDKVAVARQILERENATWEQCVMVGDDLPDVPLMKRVGWPIAVADAGPETRQVAKTITGAAGGRGAGREAVEMVLKHNGTWDQVLGWYEAS